MKDNFFMQKQNRFIPANIRQFFSYLVVGGTSTVVEWGLFFLFVYPFGWDQNLSFIAAYIVSTFVNLVFGRHYTFKNAVLKQAGDRRALVRESSLVYLVAAVGCGLNILFLNVFTGIFHMDSMLAKVVTTAVVFLFNYLARKLGIYRERKPSTKTPS